MMNVRDPAVDSALDKWRTQWPGWTFAEPFVPMLHRERAIAWLALRGELMSAAWGGEDPRPGEMKLGWWAEELQGWKQGVRRHPLGNVLQREAAAWDALAASLPALMASRERAGTGDEAFLRLEPFAKAVSGVAIALFGGRVGTAPGRNVLASLLAERVLTGGDAAVPLEFVAQAGEGAPPLTAARAWARALLERWPPPHGGAVPGRLHASLVRERLRRFAAGGEPNKPLSAWRALLTSWQAARR